MYSQLAVIDSLQLVCVKTSGHRAPRSYILSPSFASGTKSSNNFTSTLALSRGSMVSGADNLGKGINRIWGRTCRHFHPTCGARGEERTSSSLLRARAWGCFRDFCLNFSALCPYTSCWRLSRFMTLDRVTDHVTGQVSPTFSMFVYVCLCLFTYVWSLDLLWKLYIVPTLISGNDVWSSLRLRELRKLLEAQGAMRASRAYGEVIVSVRAHPRPGAYATSGYLWSSDVSTRGHSRGMGPC